ncbi:phage integrase N-terminal SAM-like domain-containing protein [Undibacterium sp. CY7W]|uniref:Phage integrase N-terminal SAM-like domain-containing protein n=1 Tax=Undibacterium rugosum TaxID=2762291 RepID=A0A923IAT6_9BURK|nr:phage integrase N-terminal SAM-like domain-containing protein [Undibacterium rugosum]
MDSTPAHASSSPKLLDQLRARIRLRHYSIRTEAQYVHWVRRYILFHGKRHPREMGAGEAGSQSVYCCSRQHQPVEKLLQWAMKRAVQARLH